MTTFYKFTPILQPKLWGGRKITQLKGLPARDGIGESWEISAVEGCESVVAEGPWAGLTISELTARLGSRLVGRAVYERYGDRFPLLVKFIDACHDLSIQVHPDDATALRHGYPMGKTEMWYALPSAPGARLYNGLNRTITPDELSRLVEDKNITSALACYDVSEGDVFFIPAGRIHAIGAGCMVAEIQQTSDTTYRIYDYDRRDGNGQPRPLHLREAAECIDYKALPDYRTRYRAVTGQATELISCPYFTTSVLPVSGNAAADFAGTDSFVIVIAVSGQGTLTADGEDTTTIKAGQTVLLPATLQRLEASGEMTLLLTSIRGDHKNH